MSMAKGITGIINRYKDESKMLRDALEKERTLLSFIDESVKLKEESLERESILEYRDEEIKRLKEKVAMLEDENVGLRYVLDRSLGRSAEQCFSKQDKQ